MGEHELEFSKSAFRHGVSRTQIRHALRNPFRTAALNEEVTMIIGDDGSRGLIEVGILSRGDRTVVVHAMTARSKFLGG